MYKFRYYAIGHSYLKHGPFEGWQTAGFWGMAATEPSKDYFHRFKTLLKENFDCEIDAIAENHADYERKCVVGATVEDYENSDGYKHMKDVLENFKPNIVTVFIGGGNTIANDDESLTLFFEVLNGLVSKYKQPETVVLCAYMNENVMRNALPSVKKYGFTPVDLSFIHEKKGYENPYYAFNQYPEYDEMAANGKVEFRTHPGDLGHLKIAEMLFDVAKSKISSEIPEGDFGIEVSNMPFEDKTENLSIFTEPEMNVNFSGFNVIGTGDGVAFSSAPGTGASVRINDLHIKGYEKFYIEMSVEGDNDKKKLELLLSCGKIFKSMFLNVENGMNVYEFDISGIAEEINSVKVSPDMDECYINVKRLGFSK